MDNTAALESLLRLSPIATVISQSGRITHANEACAPLFGLAAADELVGTPLPLLFSPGLSRTEVERLFADRAAGVATGKRSLEALGRDGRAFPVEARFATDPRSTLGIALCFIEAVASTHEAEVFYRDLFFDNPAIKLIIDPVEGWILDANPAACEFYGYRLSEMLRMRISQINLLPGPLVQKALNQARSGSQRHFVFRHRLRSGEIRDMEVHSGPTLFQGRQVLVSILHDVTEKRVLEEQLRHAQKMEAIGLLAGGVAHDFNNFLTSMLVGVELVQEELARGGPAWNRAEQLKASARTIQGITQQLMTFGRKQVVQPRALDLKAELERLSPMMRTAVGDSVDLEIEARGEPPWVRIDEHQLTQVLMNLAVNARDAMPAGGRFRARVFRRESQAILELSDTGQGMDEATLRRAFEPFFTTKEPGRGTGLGLAVVYGIVTQADGRIDVESEVGRGTTFRIRLPCLAVAPPAEPVPEEPAKIVANILPNAVPGRVLLVEDDPVVRSILAESLTQAGFDVCQVDGPAAALEAIRRPDGRIGIVVTDVMMPGMTGPALYQSVQDLRKDLKFLFISGYSDGALSGSLLAEGKVAFLAKPFNGRELAERLGELIARE